MMVKMKSMFAIGFAFTSLLSMFNSIFDGKVVAKLPFTPISWLQGLSHRNILGKIGYVSISTLFNSGSISNYILVLFCKYLCVISWFRPFSKKTQPKQRRYQKCRFLILRNTTFFQVEEQFVKKFYLLPHLFFANT